MSNPRLATRYAKSLLDLSIERSVLETVYGDMQWLQQVCRLSSEFVTVLKSPIIKSDTKEKILTAVVKGKVSELTLQFILLLIRKTRESNLPEVVNAFIRQYKEYRKIYPVQLTTATEVSEDLKKRIIEQIRATSEMQNIELETIVNPAIIGGFLLKAGDKLIDASIAYDLKAIARQFENNDFIYKIR
ncbi:MAG TPA: ATP synthase F1 subunit delta [Chitinophagaceae bacterium]|nr:ATP synthase F1 subunit delta [Chitinophagaceae bacterium]